MKVHYVVSTLVGVLSRSSRSSIVTYMGLTLLPRYRVGSWGQNLDAKQCSVGHGCLTLIY